MNKQYKMILQYTIRGEICQWGSCGKLVLFEQMGKIVIDLMFEECNGNSTRAHMGSDGGTQSADGKLLGIIFPEMLTVVNVFL